MPNKRLRVLVLAPFPPQANGPHGGARVLASGVGAIARRHDVGLLYLPADDGAAPDSVVANACAFAKPLPAAEPRGLRRWGRRAAVNSALIRGIPIWASELLNRDAAAELGALATSWRPDIVQTEFLPMTIFLDALAGAPAPRVLVDHDALERPAEPFEHLPGPVARVMHAFDQRAWLRFERTMLRRVDATVVFSQSDLAAVERAGARSVVEIPAIVPVRDRPLDPEGRTPPSLLFAGYYRHRPNVDAALWLGERIFPAVRRRHPAAALVLVGPDPPPELRRLAGDHIAVTGGVADVTPLLDRAAIVVAPIRTGGGVRVKVLEALASGKAVVATPRAVEGIRVTAGREIVIAESEDDFVEAICTLLAHTEQRRQLAAAAYTWARESMRPDVVTAGYDHLYEQLLARCRRDAGA